MDLSAPTKPRPSEAEVMAILSDSVIAAMITMYLCELGRAASDAEIFAELDPHRVLPCERRRKILRRVVDNGRVKTTERRSPGLDLFSRVYLFTSRAGRLF